VQAQILPGGEVCRYHGGSAPPGQSESRHPRRGDELEPRRFDCRSWRSVAAASHPVGRSSSAIRLRARATWSTMVAWPQQWSARSRYRRSTAATRPASTSEVSLSSKHRNVNAARTSPPKPLLLVLPKRTVRVAERQGQLMVEMVQAALREVDLSPEQASAFKAALARQARELTAPS
jgi:hypothetical protein